MKNPELCINAGPESIVRYLIVVAARKFGFQICSFQRYQTSRETGQLNRIFINQTVFLHIKQFYFVILIEFKSGETRNFILNIFVKTRFNINKPKVETIVENNFTFSSKSKPE